MDKIGTNNESKNNDEYKDTEYLSIGNNTKLMKQYIHDIRNSKILTRDMLININNLPYDYRIEVLLVYNEMMKYYLTVIEDT